MAFVNHFYNSTTRKYITLFGTRFNKIVITRDDLDSQEVQKMVVPIAYGPWQKFLSRITQDPDFGRKTSISLPRMSFEMNSLSYDGTRKIAAKQKLRKLEADEVDSGRTFQWSAAPYNIDFSLYIMTKYSEDALKIVEQILPFFKPEWTTTVKLIDGIEPIDIPLVLNGVTNEELYEGGYEERRSVLWTLNFTMKCWYFGPERNRSVIKFVDSRLWTDIDKNKTPEEGVRVYPGLTEDGEPTTDPEETVFYGDIEFGDDWGVIRVITDDPEGEYPLKE
jgi:hypothetical protein